MTDLNIYVDTIKECVSGTGSMGGGRTVDYRCIQPRYGSSVILTKGGIQTLYVCEIQVFSLPDSGKMK